MDGKTLRVELQQLLSETTTGAWLDTKTTFDYLYEAALATADRTNAFTSTQSITTVGNQSAYTLEADFLKLYLTDDKNKNYIKYYDTANYSFIYPEEYDTIILGNQTTSVLIPSRFCIRDATPLARISGTATSDGAVSNTECSLTDSTAPFASVKAGDFIHNTTDGSSGIIVSVTSTSVLVTALFGGTNNDWTSSDAYFVNLAGRFQLVLDPPPSTSGHTITLYYVKRPAPVYSDYRIYPFSPVYKTPLVNYAAWKYKYRDSQPNFGDAFYKYWDASVRRLGVTLNQAMKRTRVRVNLMRD